MQPISLDIARKLPKVELHRHMDAGCSLETLRRLWNEFEIKPRFTSDADFRSAIQIGPSCGSLVEFLTKFAVIGRSFVNVEFIKRFAAEVISEAAEDGCVYFEPRFAPAFMSSAHGLNEAKVIEAVLSGLEIARQTHPEVSVRLILIGERHLGVQHVERMADLAIEYKSNDLVGFDLAGDEANFPAELFTSAFQRAKRAGLRITAHAAEAAGPESARVVIEKFGAERIGHGARILSDPSLVEKVREEKIHIESCPECNLRIGTITGGAANHPLKHFLQKQISVSISTDDPLILGTSASSERVFVSREFGLGLAELEVLDLNGARAAFCDEETKRKVEQQVREGYQRAQKVRQND